MILGIGMILVYDIGGDDIIARWPESQPAVTGGVFDSGGQAWVGAIYE